MAARELRPFTDEERRILTRLARGHSSLVNDLCGAGCVFGVVLFLGLALLKVLGIPLRAWQPTVMAVSAFVALTVTLKMRRGDARWRTPHAEDLREGHMEVETFEVRDAIAVRGSGDEGRQYYLALADDGVLFLAGQYLHEHEKKGEFPSTRVRTTRAVHSRSLFGLECLGAPLAVSAKRRAFDAEERRSKQVPRDGEILRVDFEALRSEAG